MCFIIWIVLSFIIAGFFGSLMDFYGHKKRGT